MERLFVFCTGMLLAACQSQLLYPYQTPVIFIVVGVFLLVCFRFRHLRASIVTGLFLAAGFLYFDFHAGRQLESQIPLELEKQPILVEVTVDDLPVSKNGYWQATVNVQHTASNPMGWHASRLLLTWPKGLRPEPCSQWYVEASLKRPRSLSNPGVFDYALFLHIRGIEAKGYIRKAYWVADSSRCIHEFRRQWQEKALAAMPNTAG